MKTWTSCQYDEGLHLVSVAMIEGGTNPRRQVTRRSEEYEFEHKGCVAIEVEGGLENCPLHVAVQDIDENHVIRGK